MSSLIPLDPNINQPESGLFSFDPAINPISGLSPFNPNFSAARRWSIAQQGNEVGFSSPLNFGGLNPDLWFDKIATIDGLFVDVSSSAVILRASDDSEWAGRTTIGLKTQGFSDVILTYNGFFYVAIDTPYKDYIVTQIGNTLDLTIIPETVAVWIDSDPWIDSEAWFD